MFIFFIKIIFISFILHESLLTWWLSYVTYSAFDEYQACMTSMQKTNVMMRDYGFTNGLACCKLRKIWKSDYYFSYHTFYKKPSYELKMLETELQFYILTVLYKSAVSLLSAQIASLVEWQHEWGNLPVCPRPHGVIFQSV